VKINLEIEIDWLDPDGHLDDEIAARIESKVVNSLADKILKELPETFNARVREVLDGKLGELYEDFLSKSFSVYDEYGDVIKEDVNVKQILKERFDKFLIQKVDRDGKSASYGGVYRYEQILDRQSKEQVDDFIRELSRDVIHGIKEDINNKARERITNAILSDSKLKELIK
jgi:predicted transcriptional regulator